MNSPLRAAKRAALPAAPAVLAALSSVGAAQVVYTDIDDITIGSLNFTDSIYFDLDRSGGGLVFASTIAGDVLGADFRLHYTLGELSGTTIQKPSIEIIAPDTGAIAAKSGFVQPFELGDLIEDEESFLSDSGSFPILPGYIGLRLTDGVEYYYGWAGITAEGPDAALTLHDFAFNSTPDQSLYAGTTLAAVPEPSTYAAIAGLLAGSAALYARRRKAQVA